MDSMNSPRCLRDAKLWTEQCLGGSGAQGHDYFWFDDGNLRLEPGTASRNFLSVWFFMDASFAARLPLEMFDNICDVSLRAIDTGFVERVIK